MNKDLKDKLTKLAEVCDTNAICDWDANDPITEFLSIGIELRKLIKLHN